MCCREVASQWCTRRNQNPDDDGAAPKTFSFKPGAKNMSAQGETNKHVEESGG